MSSLTRRVRSMDILRIAGQGHPAEGADSLAEQRPDIRGHKTGNVERVGDTGLFCHLADVVAVVERGRAAFLKFEHRPDVGRHRGFRSADHLIRLGPRPLPPLGESPTLRQVPVERIVSTGLVGHDIGRDPASDQFRARHPRRCQRDRPRLLSRRERSRWLHRDWRPCDRDTGSESGSRCATHRTLRPAARNRPSSRRGVAHRPCRQARQ